MPSFQISISPSRRAAGRFVGFVRRALQRALVEEQEKGGLSQSEIARRIGVHRSVISRELQGRKDITLSRVAELSWAMGRRPIFALEPIVVREGTNVPPPALAAPVPTRKTPPAQSEPDPSIIETLLEQRAFQVAP
jgi:transcriptional regulator with XRE-family HTH domain